MQAERKPLFSLFRLNSLAVAVLGAVFATLAMQLPLGEAKAPGAGMWPLMIGLFLIAMALFVMVTEHDGADYESLTKRSLISVLGFAWIAVFVFMFSFAGFTIASLVFSVVWLKYFAKESWRFTLIASVLFTVAFVIIFSVLLRVPVPYDPALSFVSAGRF